MRDQKDREEGANPAQIEQIERLAGYKREEIYRWLAVLNEFGSYLGSSKKNLTNAAEDFVKVYRLVHPGEQGFSAKTLKKKRNLYKKGGALALAPGYGGTQNFFEWSDRAKAHAKLLYCSPSEPTMRYCHRELEIWGRENNESIPSYGILKRFIHSIPLEEAMYYRKGERWVRENLWPSMRRDRASIHPGQLYVADNKVFMRVKVEFPTGRVGHPWVALYEDAASTKILGYEICETPTIDSNITAATAALKIHVPPEVLFDSGPDFAAKPMTGQHPRRFRWRKVQLDEVTGMFTLAGVEEIHFSIPGNPRSKPVERKFWTVELDFEAALDLGKVYTLEEFVTIFDKWVNWHNQDWKSEALGGKSANELWNQWFATHEMRKIAPSALRLLTMRSAPRAVKVGRFGIRAFGAYYYNSEIMEHGGESVFYKFDPQNLAEIWAYSQRWELIARVPRRDATAWDDIAAYKELKKLEKRRKEAIRDRRKIDETIADFQRGYRPRQASGEHPDKPAKLVRVVRTVFDNIAPQKMEKTAVAQPEAVSSLSMREALQASYDRQERARSRDEQELNQLREAFFRLTTSEDERK